MSRQDAENFEPQRIELLGKLAQRLGFTQAILFAHAQECGTVITTWGLDAERSAQAEPVAWRYWKEKFACWEYSDVPLEFPAVPAGTKMEPLYLGPNVRANRANDGATGA